jgi:hypothetical protein
LFGALPLTADLNGSASLFLALFTASLSIDESYYDLFVINSRAAPPHIRGGSALRTLGAAGSQARGIVMAELDRLLHQYLLRGRRFKKFDVPELEQRWFAAVDRVNQTVELPKVEAFLEMNHIEAELELRGLTPPPPRRWRPHGDDILKSRLTH